MKFLQPTAFMLNSSRWVSKVAAYILDINLNYKLENCSRIKWRWLNAMHTPVYHSRMWILQRSCHHLLAHSWILPLTWHSPAVPTFQFHNPHKNQAGKSPLHHENSGKKLQNNNAASLLCKMSRSKYVYLTCQVILWTRRIIILEIQGAQRKHGVNAWAQPLLCQIVKHTKNIDPYLVNW